MAQGAAARAALVDEVPATRAGFRDSSTAWGQAPCNKPANPPAAGLSRPPSTQRSGQAAVACLACLACLAPLSAYAPPVQRGLSRVRFQATHGSCPSSSPGWLPERVTRGATDGTAAERAARVGNTTAVPAVVSAELPSCHMLDRARCSAATRPVGGWKSPRSHPPAGQQQQQQRRRQRQQWRLQHSSHHHRAAAAVVCTDWLVNRSSGSTHQQQVELDQADGGGG